MELRKWINENKRIVYIFLIGFLFFLSMIAGVMFHNNASMIILVVFEYIILLIADKDKQ